MGNPLHLERFSSLMQKRHGAWIDYGKGQLRRRYPGRTSGLRRLLIGWMSNWQYANKVPTEYLAHVMTHSLVAHPE